MELVPKVFNVNTLPVLLHLKSLLPLKDSVLALEAHALQSLVVFGDALQLFTLTDP